MRKILYQMIREMNPHISALEVWVYINQFTINEISWDKFCCATMDNYLEFILT